MVGVRRQLKSGERQFIDGVQYIGIGDGQFLLAWHKFLSSERPNWLFGECAHHLWGPVVEIAKLVGIRTIFHAACDLDIQPRHATLYRPRWWPLYAWGLLRTDRIFVQHAGQLSGLRRWRSKACILPKVCILPGVVEDTLSVKSPSERGRYVAWVGTLVQFKRPDILIKIARKITSVRFMVCGGPSKSSSGYGERMVNELRATRNIEYMGQVPPAKAQQVISSAALLLCTSDVEGFPNTFVQAWSNGTPVVSLNIDPGHMIARKRLGAVTGTFDRAVAEIKALIDSPRRRQEIAIRARKHIIENHSAAVVVRLFEDALRATS